MASRMAASANADRRGGKQPLVVALLERERTSVTMLITTVAMPSAADGATVHCALQLHLEFRVQPGFFEFFKTYAKLLRTLR
jgi:hypothetical protein